MSKYRFTLIAIGARISQRTARGLCLSLRFFALYSSLRPLRERYLSKSFILLVAVLLLALSTFAQLNYEFTAGKFMIKGKVIDVESETGLPLANILIVNSGKGLTCDNEGNFTMYVSKKDTLRFSSMGYISRTIYMGNIDSTHYYTLQIEMLKDFIRLKEVTIYPYRDLDDFKRAFVEARNTNKIWGIPPPKSTGVYKPKFYNPISMLYDRIKSRSSADPNFKP
jgi:hypothetical protein